MIRRLRRTREKWLLALAASGLREAGCVMDQTIFSKECRNRTDFPRASWCRRCRTLTRLEAIGYVEPDKPSDLEFARWHAETGGVMVEVVEEQEVPA